MCAVPITLIFIRHESSVICELCVPSLEVYTRGQFSLDIVGNIQFYSMDGDCTRATNLIIQTFGERKISHNYPIQLSG